MTMNIETDVLVVGGGVAGCATAYYLAREGVEVVLIDRGDVNAGASGANAGSIHSQMYYHNFNTRSAEWIDAFAPVLPLLKLSSEVWQELAAELDRDIELVIAGGLMVAETADQLRLLERKVAFENGHGIASTILSASELATLAPYISDRMVGAEFCPYEGKVNPLLATVAIAAAAKRLGARILPLTDLEAWAPAKQGFEAHTNRGRIHS
jgi:glycine/D-amino acid oxidase-like deaminating enzyme